MTDVATITAGELRRIGATGIPPEVPDCAWVPRSAVSFAFGPATLDGSVIRADCTVTLAEPFRWVNVVVHGDLEPRRYGPWDLPSGDGRGDRR